MQKKSTIKDIANQLGVSNALVSFVLNGKSKEKRISDEMTAKVLELAKSMNYTPNYLAKSLRHGKSNNLGLIIADVSNPFFAKLARYIEIEASKYGYKVIFSNSDEKKSKFNTQLSVLKNGHVDGFILTPPIGSEKELVQLKKEKIPFVIIDRVFSDVVAHSVVINNYDASYKATQRLVKNHRTNIALINVNYELLTMQQREDGFIAALKGNGIDVNTSLIKRLKFSHERKRIMEAVGDIVKNNADAVLFTTNKLGVYGVECLRELGIQIPQQMAVISFDDTLAYQISYTPITAVVQPLEQMSKEAVRILMDLFEGKYNNGHYENVELEVDFVYRESCY